MSDDNSENGKHSAPQKSSGKRFKQICYTCRTPFEPKAAGGHLLCPACVLESIRGGGRRFRPRF